MGILNNKKKNKKKKEKQQIPKSVQKTIPYDGHSDDGIFEISKGVFSRTIAFDDVNYQIAKQDDQESIFTQYRDLLNYFDSSIGVQINLINKNLNKENFQNKILLKYKNDGLDEYREEYNDMLKLQITEGKNNMRQEKSMTLTVEADNFDEARMKFSRCEAEILSNFKRIGSKTNVLGLEERLQTLHDIFRIGKEGEFHLDNSKDFKKKGMSTKDLIAPDSFEFNRNYFMIGEKYARAMYVESFLHF